MSSQQFSSLLKHSHDILGTVLVIGILIGLICYLNAYRLPNGNESLVNQSKDSLNIFSTPLPISIEYSIDDWKVYEEPGSFFRFRHPKAAKIDHKMISNLALSSQPFRYVDLEVQTNNYSKLIMRISVRERLERDKINQIPKNKFDKRFISDTVKVSNELLKTADTIEEVQVVTLKAGSIAVKLVSEEWLYEIWLREEAPLNNNEVFDMFLSILRLFEPLK